MSYVALLRRPHVARLQTASVLAGLPFGMRPLSVVLFAREATGSYGSASIVAAGIAAGTAFLSPFRGRAVDRRGMAKVLPVTAFAQAAALGGLVAAGLAHAPTSVLVALAVACGGAWPPVGAALRTLILGGLAGDDIEAAMSLQAVLNEIFFFVGPLIAALIIAVGSPAWAVGVMGGMLFAGTLLFSRVAPVRDHRGVASTGSRWAVFAHPGMRTLLMTMAMWGLVFGGLDIALPAFADAHGSAAAGGLLLAAVSVGVASGSAMFGARSAGGAAGPRYAWSCLLGAAGLAPAALATATWQLAPLCVLIGLATAPATVLGFVLVGDLTSSGTRTEAGAWIASVGAVGGSLGAGLVGIVVDATGTRAALLVPCAAALVGGVVALARRSTLLPEAVA